MKKSYYIVAAVVIVIVIIVSLGIFYSSTKGTTFNEVVLARFDTKSVSSIEIIRQDNQGEATVTVTDPSEIQKILNAFSKAKLRKSSSSQIDFTESYWMTIKTNDGKRKYGITLYDKAYINTYEYNAAVPKNAIHSYKITNEFDSTVIGSLF
ncbi:DUF5301 domain-containing protein [Paenibacillus sp. KQZ6P-2]|uniref:DUF5301 domain-containing protein n=1 Tax=Paenibacillus mangrovi TaxID=2931978 RepID=A0A9X1WM34_9BACL|nr:DUF5301 domain-containing protein [Paenibacillus mangrovi]MCJ8011812.1 DUF5301 domain-containing protein [Paenibacillus mangrovi]